VTDSALRQKPGERGRELSYIRRRWEGAGGSMWSFL
jgi:hypothetical protein